jgi:hypothetical protein
MGRDLIDLSICNNLVVPVEGRKNVGGENSNFNLLCSKLFYASIYLDERRPPAWAEHIWPWQNDRPKNSFTNRARYLPMQMQPLYRYIPSS